MMRQESTPGTTASTTPSTMSPLSQLYSLLAGPVVWFIHFVLVWGVAEMGCRINFQNWEVVSPATIQLFVTVATVIALIAVAIGGVLAYRHWKATQQDGHTGWAFEDRHRFLTLLALLLIGLFFVSIIATAMPAYFLNVCDLAA